MSEYEEIIGKIKSLANPHAVAGMKRYGINPHNNYGVSVSTLRSMAKDIGRDHQLAQQLWDSGIHDARLLAPIIAVPELVTEDQMEQWVRGFDSWDICDICCANLFDKTKFAYQKAVEWSSRDEEFVKRAGFTLMAALAVHDKNADDDRFLMFLSCITNEAGDERNYVKKAVNWALRQIGKRSLWLHKQALVAAREIQAMDSKAARWIAADALRELMSEKVQSRMRQRQKI
jgi:3-methyladenine DNA glycosylase AlkD